MISLVGGARATVERHIAEPPAYSLNSYVEHIMGPRPGKFAIPIEERFWGKVNRIGFEECWEWMAARDPNGYGRIGGKRPRAELAHRVAYRLTRGDIPLGLHVCHSCDNPPCCNPNHLFLGTDLDNNRDMRAKGRDANQHTGRTECQRGHSFDSVNTYIDSRGHRVCRACAAMHHRRYKKEKRHG